MVNLRFMGVDARPVTTWPVMTSTSGVSLCGFCFSVSMVFFFFFFLLSSSSDPGILDHTSLLYHPSSISTRIPLDKITEPFIGFRAVIRLEPFCLNNIQSDTASVRLYSGIIAELQALHPVVTDCRVKLLCGDGNNRTGVYISSPQAGEGEGVSRNKR